MLEWVLLGLFIFIILLFCYASVQAGNLESWYKDREYIIKNELKELGISIEAYVNSDKKITSKFVLKYFGKLNGSYGNHYTKPMYVHELASLLQDMEKANYLDVLIPNLVTKDPVPEITFKVKK
ncbi:hypothetical protein XaC1_494 [Xanthomonas phage XaC1]|nr:hypothetical protein XaC1_494 [Xanthomonas phage XaC1]